MDIHNLSFKQGLLIGAVAIFAFIMACQFLIWELALLAVLCYLPIGYIHARDLYARDYTLCLYFIFVALQMVHMVEHIAQITQIHLLGHTFATSHGLFGAYLDTEYLHFGFDSIWIPFWCLYFIYKRRDIYMILLLPLVLVHCVEHIVIINEYLLNGLVGNPGIFAQGGLIGSPLARPDLHFWYNAIETIGLYQGFRKAIADDKRSIN